MTRLTLSTKMTLCSSAAFALAVANIAFWHIPSLGFLCGYAWGSFAVLAWMAR